MGNSKRNIDFAKSKAHQLALLPTPMLVFVLFVAIICGASFCSKGELDTSQQYIPTQDDYTRCAHLVDTAEYPGWMYNACLINPWPTELPEIEVGGDPLLAAWINDTLAFVAHNPQEPIRFNVKLVAYEDARVTLEGQRNTWQDIDSTRIAFIGSFYRNHRIQRISLRIRYHPLKGNYEADIGQSSISFTQEEDGYAFGTFDLVMVDSTNGRTLTLTDGRFHAYLGG